MRTTLRFDGVDVTTLRTILRVCAQQRDSFPSYNHGGIVGAEPWAPVVTCEGPEKFTVIVPPVNVTTALLIMSEVDLASTAPFAISSGGAL
jgi:hypothetical protein